MSRTIKGTKPQGYDYWSARPGNKHGAGGCSTEAKRYTHKIERRNNKMINEEDWGVS